MHGDAKWSDDLGVALGLGAVAAAVGVWLAADLLPDPGAFVSAPVLLALVDGAVALARRVSP